MGRFIPPWRLKNGHNALEGGKPFKILHNGEHRENRMNNWMGVALGRHLEKNSVYHQN